MITAAVFGIVYIVEHGLTPADWEYTPTFGVHRHRTETVKINGKSVPLLLRDIDLFNLAEASRQAQEE